jgi:hypothetical protein
MPQVPGAPAITSSASLPITVSVDVTASKRLRITCLDAAVDATNVTVTSFSGSGVLYQAPDGGNDSTLGPLISSLPWALSSNSSDVMYTAPATATTTREHFNYTCLCGGSAQTGSVIIVVTSAPVADATITETILMNAALIVFLSGSNDTVGYLRAEVTALPVKGTLYQLDLIDPTIQIAIETVPTIVTNPLLGLRYVPNKDTVALDSIKYRVHHGGLVSDSVSLAIEIDSWNYTPDVPLITSNITVTGRGNVTITLEAVDALQKQFLGVYVKSLPSKGKLYQRLEDGTRGAVISDTSSSVLRTYLHQYAIAVLNVSSFWGGGSDWSPLQSLGSQDCLVYGDCRLSWSPLTADGTGGFASGSNGKGLSYANDPSSTFLQYGWTEFIELQFNQSVYVSELLIGENRGMGAVKSILARDPLGNWMPIYTVSAVDPSIQILYDQFTQYRYFYPSPICETPFLTRHLRFEMDTRSIPDWNEWDFFRLGGSVFADVSGVRYNGLGTWDVIYEPDATASGLDSFTYAASDCPNNPNRWSSNAGTVVVNIVPMGVAGTVYVGRYAATTIDLSQWSVNSVNASEPLNFTITALPSSGVLKTGDGTATTAASSSSSTALVSSTTGVAITTVPTLLSGSVLTYVPDSSCAESETSFSYTSSDPNQAGPVKVVVSITCPQSCTSSDLMFELSSCHSGHHFVTYTWENISACVVSDSFLLPSINRDIHCGEIQQSSGTAIVVYLYGAVVALVGAGFVCWFTVYHRIRSVRNTNQAGKFLYCLGCVAFQLSWLSFLGPVTETSCLSRPWLLALAYSVVLGTILRKIFIMRGLVLKGQLSELDETTRMMSKHLMTHASRKGQQEEERVHYRDTVIDRHPALIILGLLLLDVSILLPWSLLAPAVPTERSFSVPVVGATVTIPSYYCESSLNGEFMVALIGYKCIVTVGSAYAAFRLRSLGK